MEYCFVAEKLCKQYKSLKALNRCSMHIPKGAIYGFVGKNGAGKTTMIRIMTGLQKPDSGSYTLYGVPHTDPGMSKMRRRMGAVIETPSLYMDMTAKENLKMQYRMLGLPSFQGIGELLEQVGLANTGKKKVKNFSLGMKQRLGIAMALCGNPDFLVLDEPMNGLDPQGIVEIRELILKLNQQQQITVLISSHILGELAKVATCFGFIDQGIVLKEISAKELEKTCQKSIHFSVTDTKVLCRILDAEGIEYRISSETEAEIYGKISISKLAGELSENGCEIFSVKEQDESLENYYMNLIGGEKHV